MSFATTRTMDRFLTLREEMTSKATEDDKNEKRELDNLSFRCASVKSTHSSSRCAVSRSRSNTTMMNDNAIATIERSTIDQTEPVSSDWRHVDALCIHGNPTIDASTTSNTGESTVEVATEPKKIFFEGSRRTHEKNFFFGGEDATTVPTPLTRNQNHTKAEGRSINRVCCTLFLDNNNNNNNNYCHQLHTIHTTKTRKKKLCHQCDDSGFVEGWEYE